MPSSSLGHVVCPRSLLCSLLMAALIFSSESSARRSKTPPAPLPKAMPLSTLSLPQLSEAQRARLSSVEADPKPEQIVRDSHYWVSNEHSHQLWYPYLKELRGGYIGVGTDQNYLLAGWARSELLVLMDFDQAIPELHRIYHCFFRFSGSPEHFFSRWKRTRRKESVALVRECLGPLASTQGRSGARWLRYQLKIFRRIQNLIFRRLRKTKLKFQALKIPTFLSDQDQYDWIRSLWQGGRVLAIRGDLTASKTMRELGALFEEIRLPLNVLYLSNAEQYFAYTPQFRRNIISQSWGPDSLVLRTLGWRMHGYVDDDEGYHYNIQSGENLSNWMRLSRVSKVGRLLRYKSPLEPAGFSRLSRPPIEGRRPPQIAP